MIKEANKVKAIIRALDTLGKMPKGRGPQAYRAASVPKNTGSPGAKELTDALYAVRAPGMSLPEVVARAESQIAAGRANATARRDLKELARAYPGQFDDIVAGGPVTDAHLAAAESIRNRMVLGLLDSGVMPNRNAQAMSSLRRAGISPERYLSETEGGVKMMRKGWDNLTEGSLFRPLKANDPAFPELDGKWTGDPLIDHAMKAAVLDRRRFKTFNTDKLPRFKVNNAQVKADMAASGRPHASPSIVFSSTRRPVVDNTILSPSEFSHSTTAMHLERLQQFINSYRPILHARYVANNTDLPFLDYGPQIYQYVLRHELAHWLQQKLPLDVVLRNMQMSVRSMRAAAHKAGVRLPDAYDSKTGLRTVMDKARFNEPRGTGRPLLDTQDYNLGLTEAQANYMAASGPRRNASLFRSLTGAALDNNLFKGNPGHFALQTRDSYANRGRSALYQFFRNYRNPVWRVNADGSRSVMSARQPNPDLDRFMYPGMDTSLPRYKAPMKEVNIGRNTGVPAGKPWLNISVNDPDYMKKVFEAYNPHR